jgi:hypothetical protein
MPPLTPYSKGFTDENSPEDQEMIKFFNPSLDPKTTKVSKTPGGAYIGGNFYSSDVIHTAVQREQDRQKESSMYYEARSAGHSDSEARRLSRERMNNEKTAKDLALQQQALNVQLQAAQLADQKKSMADKTKLVQAMSSMAQINPKAIGTIDEKIHNFTIENADLLASPDESVRRTFTDRLTKLKEDAEKSQVAHRVIAQYSGFSDIPTVALNEDGTLNNQKLKELGDAESKRKAIEALKQKEQELSQASRLRLEEKRKEIPIEISKEEQLLPVKVRTAQQEAVAKATAPITAMEQAARMRQPQTPAPTAKPSAPATPSETTSPEQYVNEFISSGETPSKQPETSATTDESERQDLGDIFKK